MLCDPVSYQRVCGVDVSKETLDIRIRSGVVDLALTVPNTKPGVAKVLKLCRKHDVQIIVAEATGGYQQTLARGAWDAGFPIAIVNPSRVRHYALAEGLIAKTDRVDGLAIAMYARKIGPAPSPARSPQQERLSELACRRSQLVQIRASEACREEKFSTREALQSVQTLRKCLDKEIQKLDKLLSQAITEDLQLQTKAQAADTVTGIGRVSAIALVVAMPELGTLSQREVASLAGLAPFNKDSGKQEGARHIFGGRAAVRKALYVCALSAVRFDPVIKAFYEKLLAKGKPTLVALTACMRKLIVIINARVREAMAAAKTTPSGQGGVAIAAGG